MKKNLIILLVLIFLATPQHVFALLTDQIIVDNRFPEWLFYNRDSDNNSYYDPHFMCAPGDPEDFLYRGSRNSDGTRNGDQMIIINKLKNNLGNGSPANGIYMQIIRSHGGDGTSDHNPFINSNPASGIDQDILSQWHTWFSEMDNAGITIYLFFWDDDARVTNWGTDPQAETKFYQSIVNEFERYKNLIWIFAEEYQEEWNSAEVSNRVATIRSADDHNHPIAVHKLPGIDFNEFANDGNVDQFSIQMKVAGNDNNHNQMLQAWNNASGRYNLNLSEPRNIIPNDSNRTEFRQRNWSVALGGAYIMNIEWTVTNTPNNHLKDCGVLVNFMESTNFFEMSPNDSLKTGSTNYVLAKPDDSYIAYAYSYSANMGVSGLTNGTYLLKWLDTVSGSSCTQQVSVSGSSAAWTKPIGYGNELALYIKKGTGTTTCGTSATPTPTPTKTPVDGDANGDGLVNGIDFVVFMSHFGQSTPNGAQDGDFSGNGTVGSEDYDIWLTNYPT